MAACATSLREQDVPVGLASRTCKPPATFKPFQGGLKLPRGRSGSTSAFSGYLATGGAPTKDGASSTTGDSERARSPSPGLQEELGKRPLLLGKQRERQRAPLDKPVPEHLTDVLRLAKPDWTDIELIDAEAKLAEVGVHSIAEFQDALRGHLNGRLRKVGLKAFKASTIRELRCAAGIREVPGKTNGNAKRMAQPLEENASTGEEALAGDTPGGGKTVWISLSDMDTELPTVEGVMNQLDIDEEFDGDWHRCVDESNRHTEGSQSLSSEGEVEEASHGRGIRLQVQVPGRGVAEVNLHEVDPELPSVEGLMNQVDLDEDYDRDWRCGMEVQREGSESDAERRFDENGPDVATLHTDIAADAATDASEAAMGRPEETMGEHHASNETKECVATEEFPDELLQRLELDDKPIPALDELLRNLDRDEERQWWEAPGAEEREEDRQEVDTPPEEEVDVLELERQARQRLEERLEREAELTRAERLRQQQEAEEARLAAEAEQARLERMALARQQARTALTAERPHAPEQDGDRARPVDLVMGLRVHHKDPGRMGTVVALPFGDPPFFLVRFDDDPNVKPRKVADFRTETGRPLRVGQRSTPRPGTLCPNCRRFEVINVRSYDDKCYCGMCWMRGADYL